MRKMIHKLDMIQMNDYFFLTGDCDPDFAGINVC